MRQENKSVKIYNFISLLRSWMTSAGVLVGVGLVLLLLFWGVRAWTSEPESNQGSNQAERVGLESLPATDTETTPARFVEPITAFPSASSDTSMIDELGAAPLSPAAQVSLLLTAQTGSGNQDIVYNGETITYTLTFSPTGFEGEELSDVVILNDLSVFQRTFQDVRCADCIKEIESVSIPNPWGGVVVVTFTKAVKWSFDLVQANEPVISVFSAQVVGQADGVSFSNVAYAQYKIDGLDGSATSSVVETTVRVPIRSLGESSTAAAPTWFSNDVGGTLDLDWGDFDGDGDFDLVLGSSLGATVYENKGEGVLDEIWTSPPDYDGTYRLAFGVGWADFDNDNHLELVVVGDSLDQTAVTSGTNYIYNWYREQNDVIFQETDVFSSNYQLVRVATGNFDDDEYVDLVASTNGINPACPVLLYTNTLSLQGPGEFFAGPGECVSTQATASLGPGDFDNDDDKDLSVGLFPDLAMLFKNDAEGTLQLPFIYPVMIEEALAFLPYDFSWGDYNGDGYLDLAAAFPFERKSQVYVNQAGLTFDLPIKIRSRSFLTPLSVDWGDLNGDGRLDLVMAGSPLEVYQYNTSGEKFSEIDAMSPFPQTGQYWSIQVVDYDNDGDLDLSLSDRNGPSLIFTTFAPFLNPTLEEIASFSASSVAWGDADGRYCNDLLFGAGQGHVVHSPLYHTDRYCAYSQTPLELGSGFGTRDAAFGDLEGDGDLDVAFALPGVNRVYRAGETQPVWSSETEFTSYSVAWGDADDDGDLDLLVGNDGPNEIFVNQGGVLGLGVLPVWQTEDQSDTRSIVWGDFNRDRYLDFAVGNVNQPNQIYCNNKDSTFSLIWSSQDSADTRSMAWGDYDRDGDLDLAVGNYGQPNYIYQNLTCETHDCETELVQNLGCGDSAALLSATPVWTLTSPYNQTVALAWGDWDNDGDPELAVGNENQPDQVYANLSKPGSPQLAWLWTSAQALETTGIAWGDKDGDGDLDLAISQGADSGPNGFYENTYIQPSHLIGEYFANTMPLPNNPSYLAVERPGNTDNAYFFSSAELLSGYYYPTVPIHYTLYDPDGTRDMSLGDSNLPGDPILDTVYEFSVDAGGTWQSATPADGWSGPVLTTTRKGFEATFLWNAVADQAISDNALFRITIVQQNQQGPFQRAVCSAVSPPFRVRGLTCIWPQDPFIQGPGATYIDTEVTFVGGYENVSGSPIFKWDFGDGTEPFYGDTTVEHTFGRAGSFDVQFSITGEACPVSKTVTATHQIMIGGGKLYLPIVRIGVITDQISSSAMTEYTQTQPDEPAPEQVRWLGGTPNPDQGCTYLEWQPVAANEQILGYRLYRRLHKSQVEFELIATLPADVYTYVDKATFCDQRYYVTAFNAVGESFPSITNYISPPCRD